jgi:hypothetical protein
MKKIVFLSGALLSTHFSFGQNAEYTSLVKIADSLYKTRNYKLSASTYSAAFKVNGWRGMTDDRYNAACSWALANNADSSFFQLNRIATKASYMNYGHINTDPDLNSLHNDNRWKPLLDLIKKTRKKQK